MRKTLTLTFFFLFFILFTSNIFGQLNNPRYFNEKLAVKSLTEINSAQETYRATTGNGNYGSVSDLRNAGLIDEVLATGEKYGYNFLFSHADRTPSTNASFQATATPRRYRKTGITSFYVNNSGEIRGADKNGEPAIISDPILDFCKIIESSNEKCVIKDLHLLLSAEITFRATTGIFGSFHDLYRAGLIRGSLLSSYTHEYSFAYNFSYGFPNMPDSLKIYAVPFNYGTSGTRSFFIDLSGVVRGADKNGQRANEKDPPITD